MARLQAISQLRALNHTTGLVSSTSLEGGADGVPKMHPLKSSNPVFKAGSLIHGLRLKKLGLKLPKL